MATASPTPKKPTSIVVSGDMSTGQQFVVTQSKGATIIQPASVAGSGHYIVTGTKTNGRPTINLFGRTE